MQRLSDLNRAATLVVVAAAAYAATPAAAQNIGDPGLIISPTPGLLDSGAMSPRPGVGGAPTAFGIPKFEVPTYGNAPGFGAGSTGFVSSGPRRKRGKLKPGSLPPIVQVVPGTLPIAQPPGIAPNAPTGTAGSRPIPQYYRRGAPPIDPPESSEPLAPVVLPPRRAVVDPAPFDQLGLRAGSFLIKPAIELSGGYDNNPARVTPPKGAPEAMGAGELLVRSDWERHALNVDVHGNYLSYGSNFPGSPVSLARPMFDSKAVGRIDVSRDDRIDLETRFLIGTDNPGSPNIQAGLTRLPVVATVGTTFGYEHDFNRFGIIAKSTFDRSVWQESTFTDGTTGSNADRNYDQYGLSLRGSYDLLPGIKPFVEASADTRVHDMPIDSTGAERDSKAGTIKAGSSFAFIGALTGEASVGWTQRVYQDPTLPNVSGLVFDSSLIYLATPLTTVKLTAVSATGELIVQGASGVLRRDFGLEVDHDFRRWLTAIIKLGYGADSYFGLDRFDNRFSVDTSLVYKFSRTVWLKAQYRHEWLRSTVTSADYNADIGLLTLRFQD